MNHEPTIDVIRELTVAGIGTSHPQRIALLIIAAAGEPVQMGLVADRIGMSRGSTTSIIEGLVAAGLVKRVHDLGDRRTVHVEATKAGLRVIAKAEKAAGVASREAA